MQTLFIYDDLGKIFSYVTGDFQNPIGLQHLIEEMPENSFPIKVNVEGEAHFVEYGQHPKSDSELLRAELEDAILELTMLIYGGGL